MDRLVRSESEQVIDGLVCILANQVDHALSIMSLGRAWSDGGERADYIRHDGLSIGSLDISKGHLGALVLVESDLGLIDVCDPVEGDWSWPSGHDSHTDDHSTANLDLLRRGG